MWIKKKMLNDYGKILKQKKIKQNKCLFYFT